MKKQLLISAFCLLALNTLVLADEPVTDPEEVFMGYDIYATTIIREGNVWKQWFGGWMSAADLPWDRIYYSVSEDSGMTWSEPLEIFTIENVQVNDPSVIRLWDPDSSRYYYQMYYTYYPSGYGDETNYIAVSTSLDGVNWTHLGDQEKGVLIGADNGIDMEGAWAPSALCLDSLGTEIHLYFHNNIPTGVYRTTLSDKGLTFNKETSIVVAGGFRANVDVTIAPDSTWWMFYNSPGFFADGTGKFETSKMYSEDGINWIESFYNPILAFEDQITVTPHVVWEDSMNYQLWYGLGPSIVDFDVYRQNFHLETEPVLPIVASSEALNVLGPENAIDKNLNTFWSSRGYVDEVHGEWIYLDFYEVRQVYQIILAPRVDENGPACFPAEFKLQYSQNGFDWTDIPGHSYTNFSRPDTLPCIFTLDEAVTAQYIRVNTTRLNPDSYGNFYFQLAEFEVIHELSNVLPNNNPYLSSIRVNDAEIDGFSLGNFEYDVYVSEGSDTVVTATPEDPAAGVTISQDENRVTIRVVAENKVNIAHYYVTVHHTTTLESTLYNQIEIFPNPAKNKLTITNTRNTILHLYNLNGKLVYTAKCLNSSTVLNVESFVPGLYLLKLEGKEAVKFGKVLIGR
ncbi:MAG: T9SS type A sorting domain-containing protein [Bacteroidetes bacterium]|nr:T9SS type A sorting domain-containing protein [Bacteroidota bacterium]